METKIKAATVILLFCFITSLIGCSGGGTGNANADSIVNATNVIINKSAVDTSSSDLQSALEDLEPILSQIVVGTWNTYSYGNGFSGETGSITIRSDGTFIINSGVVSIFGAAAYMLCGGSYTCGALAGKTGTWEVIKGMIFKLDLDEISGIDPSATAAAYAEIVAKKKTKLVVSAPLMMSVWEKVPEQ